MININPQFLKDLNEILSKFEIRIGKLEDGQNKIINALEKINSNLKTIDKHTYGYLRDVKRE